MRVTVYEATMMISVALLNESIIQEVSRIAIMSKSSELYKFRKIADSLTDRYTVGVSLTEKERTSAYASFYFDFEEDSDYIYFKLASADLISNNHT